MRFFSLSGLYSDIQAFFAIKKRIISADYPLVVALFFCLIRNDLISWFSQVIEKVLCNFCV